MNNKNTLDIQNKYDGKQTELINELKQKRSNIELEEQQSLTDLIQNSQQSLYDEEEKILRDSEKELREKERSFSTILQNRQIEIDKNVRSFILKSNETQNRINKLKNSE